MLGSLVLEVIIF